MVSLISRRVVDKMGSKIVDKVSMIKDVEKIDVDRLFRDEDSKIVLNDLQPRKGKTDKKKFIEIPKLKKRKIKNWEKVLNSVFMSFVLTGLLANNESSIFEEIGFSIENIYRLIKQYVLMKNKEVGERMF